MINYEKSINFKLEGSFDMTLKISEDFTKTVLGNKTENWMLSEEYDDNMNVIGYE